MATSNPTGNSFTTSDSNTNNIGFYVTPNKQCEIVSVIKSATCNATTATVYNSSKTSIGSATFSGNTATFSSPLSVTNAANYYVMTSGHSTRHYQTAQAYPRNRTDITYTNNAYMTTINDPSTLILGIGEDANITDIETQTAAVASSKLLLVGMS